MSSIISRISNSFKINRKAMDLTGIALIIASSATLLTAATTTVVQLMVLHATRKNSETLGEVKHLVNSASEDAKAYNLVLSDSLRNAGQHVPVDPSVTPPEVKHPTVS